MTTKALLIAARARIADESHWTQHVSARDAQGQSVHAGDPHACRWCAYGAIIASAGATQAHSLEALECLERAMGKRWGAVSFFNDAKSHRSVLQLFTKAIHAQPEAGA